MTKSGNYEGWGVIVFREGGGTHTKAVFAGFCQIVFNGISSENKRRKRRRIRRREFRGERRNLHVVVVVLKIYLDFLNLN